MTIDRIKSDVIICCVGSFINIIAMTVIMPFLPEFISTMGHSGGISVLVWSSLCYSATFLTAALLAPLWGRLSDHYGSRLNLIRASIGMLISMTLTSFAQTPLELFICRALVGVAGGYTSGAAILIAKRTGGRGGLSQGVLSSSILLGSLIGPPAGSWLALKVGMAGSLRIAALMIFFNCVATYFLAKDTTISSRKKTRSTANTADLSFSIVYLTVIAVVMAASISLEPMISTYVKLYSHTQNVLQGAGLALSAIAVASIISATLLGYLGDKIGYKIVIIISLMAGAFVLILHAFAQSVWQIVAVRFALGLALGGIIPCVRAYIKSVAKPDHIGALIGLTTSAQYVGQVVGPVSAGFIAAQWTLNIVFYSTSLCVLAAALFVCFSQTERSDTITHEQ
ncbi:MFS transporter [Saccharibacter sp. 17.LH.SD]|uniref:MFS transporter n=1 Tax=Saccharibacter sp. 17.LH.SD TaxID=2689393 RepID=UPI00136BB88F|nr:MFS transporter [Saccharibacter sp. 17.LH.SD]MXV44418.1 MFS transporter [Saccharibacter sp. 17.LH.SD]